MTSMWIFVLWEVSVIVCGVVSGVFLTFSDFVMRSLDAARTAAGVEVMQVINREVYRSVFMFLFLGMSALSLFLVVYAYFRLAGPATSWVMAGGTIYFTGVFVVSVVFNVPMNNRLEAKEYSGTEAATYWTNTYMPHWTFWNRIRAISSAVAAVCYLVAGAWWAQGMMATG